MPTRLLISILCLITIRAFAAPPDWVRKSDENTQVLLDVMARLDPEEAASLGITGLDDRISDFAPGHEQRRAEALGAAVAELQKRLATEKDADVKQDLRILIASAE